jgi:Protein of unknown function (DUF3237)
MRFEPLYQVRFTTPERWSVELSGKGGSEAQSFLIAEGRCEGSISGRFRAANFPRTRVDGTLLPDFRGVVQTDDGAALLFTLRGYFRPATGGLVGSMTHVTDDERYARLNDVVCAVTGEVGVDEVVLEVAERVWESLLRAGSK